MISNQQNIKLCWAKSKNYQEICNFGDALSPIIVSAASSKQCQLAHFDSKEERLVSTGTIGHNIIGGIAHIWGTGFDKEFSPKIGKKPYSFPEKTKFLVHALRGKYSEKLLNKFSIRTTNVYGDPVMLLPEILHEEVEKKYELGIIVHITELEEYHLNTKVKAQYKRYNIPKSLENDVIIINTLCEPSLESIQNRINLIRSCKRILSTSLHGIVIPETYKIPCMNFNFSGNGLREIEIDDFNDRLDHRFRDLYSGLHVTKLSVYGRERELDNTPWEEVCNIIDKNWVKKNFNKENFLSEFPLYSGKLLKWDELAPFKDHKIMGII